MPQRSPDTNTKHKPSAPGGVAGTLVALVIFGAGLATCVVGLVRYSAAGTERVAVTVVPARPTVTDPVATPPKPELTIPVPDDAARLGSAVQQELVTRVQRARQALRTPERQGDFAEAQGRLGVFYEAYGYSSYALDCFVLAMSADAQNARWKYHWAILTNAHGNADDAIVAMRQVTALEPDYGPAFERLGLMLLVHGAYAEADEAFQRVVTLHAEAASGYVGLGKVRLATGKLEEAVEQFRQALSKDMGNGQAHYLLGQTYQRLGRVHLAGNELARGARSGADALPDPWRSDLTIALVGPKARLGYARSLAQMGRVDEAIELLAELHSIFPMDVDVANSLAAAHLQNGQPELALPVLHAAVDTGRRSYLTYTHLASTLLRTEELDAALDFAIEVTEIAPMTARGYFVKGRVLYAMTRNDEAIVAFRKAVELSPRHGETHFRLGLTAARLGRHNEAIESLETAAEFAPKSVIPLYNLGMIHARAGRHDLAADALERALKIDPFDAEIRTALDRVETVRRNR